MRNDLLGVGMIVLILGIVAAVYPDQVCYLGQCVTYGHPYEGLGTALVILGLFAIGLGAVLNPQQPVLSLIQTPPRTAPSNLARYCDRCGQMLRPAAVFCPRCGQRAWLVDEMERPAQSPTATADPTMQPVAVQKQWRCHNCGVLVNAAEMPFINGCPQGKSNGPLGHVWNHDWEELIS